MHLLITGGCGYIGSHTVLTALEAGHQVIVADNLVNSHVTSLERVQQLTGKTVDFHNLDVCDEAALRALFAQCRAEGRPIDAAIHFAGLKAVGESSQIPLEYYRNNLISALTLARVMAEFGCKKLVFSSSATVYGNPASLPIREDFPTSTTNPYGATKLMIENILRDVCSADPAWDVMLLRYFNPVGAHPSGCIGEDPQGIPNNLLPYICQVASGKLQQLSIFGNNYPTQDGTGVRDYIHVMDLAAGHIAALRKMEEHPGLCIYNLGTGQGYSVLEMVHAFEKTSGINIRYKIVPRRQGDIASCYADTSKAERELGWKAEYGLEDMMRDAWNWQRQNPLGFN